MKRRCSAEWPGSTITEVISLEIIVSIDVVQYFGAVGEKARPIGIRSGKCMGYPIS